MLAAFDPSGPFSLWPLAANSRRCRRCTGDPVRTRRVAAYRLGSNSRSTQVHERSLTRRVVPDENAIATQGGSGRRVGSLDASLSLGDARTVRSTKATPRFPLLIPREAGAAGRRQTGGVSVRTRRACTCTVCDALVCQVVMCGCSGGADEAGDEPRYSNGFRRSSIGGSLSRCRSGGGVAACCDGDV